MELPAAKTKVILAKSYGKDSGIIGAASPFFNLDPWRPTKTFLDGTISSTASQRQKFGDAAPIFPESA